MDLDDAVRRARLAREAIETRESAERERDISMRGIAEQRAIPLLREFYARAKSCGGEVTVVEERGRKSFFGEAWDYEVVDRAVYVCSYQDFLDRRASFIYLHESGVLRYGPGRHWTPRGKCPVPKPRVIGSLGGYVELAYDEDGNPGFSPERRDFMPLVLELGARLDELQGSRQPRWAWNSTLCWFGAEWMSLRCRSRRS